MAIAYLKLAFATSEKIKVVKDKDAVCGGGCGCSSVITTYLQQSLYAYGEDIKTMQSVRARFWRAKSHCVTRRL
jgi:hypothetical protein